MSMSNKIAAAGFIALCFLMTPCARAQEAALTAAPVAVEAPLPETQDAPLTVSGIVVDKTDKNAVIARDGAIIEARRAAFQKLAERNLDAESLKTFKVPGDDVLSILVQDFEITNEQLSRTRYVGTFTVRFTPAADTYVKPKPAAVPVAAAPAAAAPTVAAPVTPHGVLILPYLETAESKLLLWEDGNAWLRHWQTAPPPVAAGWTLMVPLGDITDVAAGPSAGVWTGDYTMLDKLLENYGAEEIILAVVTGTGDSMPVDLYSYRARRFEHLPALTPVTAGEDAAGAYAIAARDVMEAVQHPRVPAPEAPVLAAPVPAVPAGPVALDAEMVFDNAARWIEMQKRISGVTPPATVEIKSLSSESAAFTLRFGGGIDELRTALAARGVTLSEPAVSVADTAAAPAPPPLYELQLAN